MAILEKFEQYQGYFMDVRLIDEEAFIKMVFQQSNNIQHGQISRPLILADIVIDGDEEAYLKQCMEAPDSLQRLPLTESQVAEIKVGNRING